MALRIERQLRHVTLLTALVVAADGCTEPDVRRPFAIDVVSGGGQQGEVGARLPVDVAVQVTDSVGRSVPRATVTFEITTAPSAGFTAGSIEPVSVETDVAGVARTRWTLGTQAGEQTLRAWAGSAGLTTTPNITVSVTARPGAAISLAPASPGIVAITVGDSVRVAVVGKDRYGNVLAPSGLSWRVTDPSVASVSRTELPPDHAAMVVANAGGATVIEARDAAARSVRFDVRTYVGPGRDIAYESSRTIYLLSADGATTTALGPGWDPSWSPDGRQIAFTGDAGNLGTAIHVMNADGSGRRALSDPATHARAVYPTWSPDGRKIAFVAPADDPGGVAPMTGSLFTMNADGSATTLVFRTLSLCSIHCPGIEYPTWSPDGTKVAYSIAWARSTAAVGNVYVVNADGSGDRELVSTAEVERGAAWSPDGGRVVFQSSRTCCAPVSVFPSDLYVVNADGSGRTRLTFASEIGSFDRFATWSPDGRIAFVRARGTLAEFFVINGDGTELRRFASIPSVVGRLAWRP